MKGMNYVAGRRRVHLYESTDISQERNKVFLVNRSCSGRVTAKFVYQSNEKVLAITKYHELVKRARTAFLKEKKS